MSLRSCQSIHPTPTQTASSCRLCWLFVNDERYRALWSGKKSIPPPVPSRVKKETTPAKKKPARKTPLSCVLLGPATGETLPCQACGGKEVRVPLRSCSLHGSCSEDRVLKTAEGVPVKCCRICDDKILPTVGHFNTGIVEFGGRTLLASRKGWIDSRVWITSLADGLSPEENKSVQLQLDHPLCRGGQEDPRLFVFHGRLHLSFVGVEVGKPTRTHQMLAELGDDLKPVNVWCPSYKDRQFPKEKNWTFFEGADGELYSVYSISPHVVLRHRGTVAERVSDVSWYPTWGGLGHLRGGAPPVRVGDEFYHFFHGMTWRKGEKHKEYSLGVYTFDAEPPFAPRRGPALLALPPADRPGWYASVVFPCGAILRGDKWAVSYGVHDERYEIREWTTAEIDAALTSADDTPADLASSVRRAVELPGWCPYEKAISAVDIVLRERPAVCVEIGVFGGRWSAAVALALKHVGGGMLYAVDPWDTTPGSLGTHSEEYRAWWESVNLPAAKKAFLSAVDSFGIGDFVRVVEADSDAGAELVPSGIGLLHIDGNHSAEVSTRDVATWVPKVRSGGWIAFDDAHWDSVKPALCLLEKSCELIRDYTNWRLYRKR